MKTRKILIIGKQGVGKTRLAELLSATYNLPVTEGLWRLSDIDCTEDRIYTSNCISEEYIKEFMECYNDYLKQALTIIHIQ